MCCHILNIHICYERLSGLIQTRPGSTRTHFECGWHDGADHRDMLRQRVESQSTFVETHLKVTSGWPIAISHQWDQLINSVVVLVIIKCM